MLIVLSGSESIHKRFLQRKITAALNTFTVDGYTVDFNSYPFKVLNSDGEVVMQAGSKSSPLNSYGEVIQLTEEQEAAIEGSDYGAGIDTLISELDGEETLDKILQLEQDLFITKEAWFKNDLSSEGYDFSIIEDLESDYTDAYNRLITNYNNKTIDNYVVCGIFGKHTIEQLRTDLGAENVHVVNIIRNPSVSWFMHQKTDAFYALPSEAELGGRSGDTEKFVQSQLSCIALKSLDYVQTVKFEDIIQTGLTVLGQQVTLPVGYESYNNKITQFENDVIVPQGLATADTITDINTKLSNFTFSTMVEILAESSLDSSTVDAAFPSNFFTELGYTALTYAEITSS